MEFRYYFVAEGQNKGIAGITSNTYVHTIEYCSRLVGLAMEDFPELTPEQIQIVVYSDFYNKQMGIEFDASGWESQVPLRYRFVQSKPDAYGTYGADPGAGLRIEKYLTVYGRAILHAKTTAKTWSYVQRLVEAARQDFPEIPESNLSLKLNSDRWHNQLTLEFPVQSAPQTYEQIGIVDHAYH